MSNLVYLDRAREAATVSGTGPFTRGSAPTGYQDLTAAEGKRIAYAAVGGADWEVGVGMVSAGTVTRDIVLSSSNAGALVAFTPGSVDLFGDAPAAVVGTVFSDTAPVKVPGRRWFDTDSVDGGVEYICYDDGTSLEWLALGGGSSGGTAPNAPRPLSFGVASAAKALGVAGNGSGNYTTGIGVHFTGLIRVKGVAFFWNGPAASLKASIWLVGTATLKGSGALTTTAAGYYEIEFATPYDVDAADLYKLHVLGVYEMTGAAYMQGISSVFGTTFPQIIERSCYATDSGLYSAGDAMPTTHNPYVYGHCIEPILAEPPPPAPPPPQPPPPGYDIQWLVSGPVDVVNAHAIASSAGVTTVTDSGAATGYAGSFSGASPSQVVMTSDSALSAGNGQFALRMVLKPTAPGVDISLFDNSVNLGRDYGLAVILSPAGAVKVYAQASYTIAASVANLSFSAVSEIVIQRRSMSSGGLELWVNGVLDSTGTSSGSLANFSSTLVAISGLHPSIYAGAYYTGEMRRVQWLIGGLIY